LSLADEGANVAAGNQPPQGFREKAADGLGAQFALGQVMRAHERSIAILSDQTLFRQAVHELLRAHGFHHVRDFSSSHELVEATRSHPPSLLLIDLDHEREDTMSLVRSIRHDLLHTHMVVIGTALRQGAADGACDDRLETPRADVAALAAALELASPARRFSAEVERQHKLWSGVTPRQRDVLRWLATGSDNRAIARKLRVGERAVKAHVSALLHTFGLENRTQLALLADRAGLRPPAVRLRG
jgi:DNA-binding NarL/FixJ family response regulator